MAVTGNFSMQRMTAQAPSLLTIPGCFLSKGSVVQAVNYAKVYSLQLGSYQYSYLDL